MTLISIQSALGEIVVELYEKQAPRTCAHFLSYIDEGYYEGAAFYRTVREGNQPPESVKIGLIEAGFSNHYYDEALRDCFMSAADYRAELGPRGSHPPISVETTAQTGLKHLDGTLSFGRCGKDEVDDSFFICMGDQPELDFGGRRHLDGLGFSACGQVVAGLKTARDIWQLPAEGQRLLEEVTIISLRRKA